MSVDGVNDSTVASSQISLMQDGTATRTTNKLFKAGSERAVQGE